MKVNILMAFLFIGILGCKKEDNPQNLSSSASKTVFLDLTLVEAMSYKRLANQYFKISKHYRTKVGRSEPVALRSETIGSVRTDRDGVLRFSYTSNNYESGWIEIANNKYKIGNIGELNQSISALLYNDTIGLIDVHFKFQSVTFKDTLYVESTPGEIITFPFNKINDGYAFTTSRFKSYGNLDTIVFALGYQQFNEALSKHKQGIDHNNRAVFEVSGWPKKEVVLLRF
jgi:hypothetical protein